MTQPRLSNGACPLELHALAHSHSHAEPAGPAALPSGNSPTTPDLEVATTPCTDPSTINHFALSLETSLPLPQPQPLTFPPVYSPIHPHEDRPLFDFDFAGAVPPTPVSLPTSTIVKTAHNLRLPSFDVLGIAAPHPDRFHLRQSHSFSSTPLGAGPLSKPEDPLHALSPSLHTSTTSPRATTQLEHVLPVVTPPPEPGPFHWGHLVTVRPGLGSPPNSDLGVSPSLNVTAGATAPQAPIVVPVVAAPSDAASMATWVEEAKNTIIAESGCLDLTAVKVLSHALPCPSLNGHLFGQLIAAIHDRTVTNTSWINVFHALPGRYTLSDLPKSPPSTPGPAVGGDEYFTSKVFDSAVAIPDYQLNSNLLPPSPRPVVPPGSINISVVERYIPPTNTNEYATMFSLRGHSLLYDRFSELSLDNGILFFVYPTKTGAKTFMQKYLGPIIEPLLRSVTVVHDLHSELGRSLGQMASVNYLNEYEQLAENVRTFCDLLSEHTNGQKGDGKGRCLYEVIHAAKEEIAPNRLAWADDWWIKQEKPRIRDAITKYFRKSKKLPTGELTGPHLLQELLEGVSTREYEDGPPTQGLEVGVFIIRKSRRA